ncbi:MAG TPA: ABC transporter permease [Acidobacteriaceae bacterium]|nr:ABC transporter permease [Acidobacteriaceae bacterium]
MSTVTSMLRKLALLFRRGQFGQELDEEMAFHQEQMERELREQGKTREEARYAAMRTFGNTERMRERSHDAIGFSMETVAQDVRFSLRQMKRNPGFAVTAVLVLTMGIAASTAIFGFVDAALIRPLPYAQPSQLVVLYETTTMGKRYHLSYLDYLDWKRENTVFQSIDLYTPSGFTLKTPDGLQAVTGSGVTAGFFRELGVVPAIGRDFRPVDDQASAPRTVLLSYSTWQTRYGGRKDVLGQTVVLDGNPNEIVGVLPQSFHFAPAEPAEFWTTARASDQCEKMRGCKNFFGVARLKPGVSFQAAFADIQTIAEQLAREYPDANQNRGAYMMALTEVIVGDTRPILLALLGGAALLLLIAAVNVASLLLVRSESRRREMAVRGALGASPVRLVRQFVTEGLTLVAVASVLGLAAACGVMQLPVLLIPKDMLAKMPYIEGLGLNLHIVLFVCGVFLATGAIFSLIPALRHFPGDLREALTSGGRSFAGVAWRRLGANLVVVELTVAMVLLAGAGLLGKSFYRLLHSAIGLEPDHLATLQVSAEGLAYAKDAQQIQLQREIQEKVSQMPGVQSVAFTDSLPLGDGDGAKNYWVVGRPYHGEQNEVLDRDVSYGYFSTIEAPLLRGRSFREDEDESMPLVAVINQQMAQRYFPGENPLRQQIYGQGDEKHHIEIVGVVNDIQEGQLDAAPGPAVYLPFRQHPSNGFAVVVRTRQDADAMLSLMTAAVHGIDPGLATYDPITMQQRIHDSPATYLHRSSAYLVGGFAALALMLGIIGLYGVVSYSVSQRTREIGVRMALGAERATVHRMVLREAARLTLVGLAAGIVCAIGAAALMRSLLFGVQPWDLATLAGVSAVLGSFALLASYLPARRAARVNPADALRAE